MVQASLKKLAYRFGYDFTMRKLPQYDTMRRRLGIPRDMDSAFADICEKAAPFTMTSVERMYALYEGVKHVVTWNVPGDLVECGVWQGGSSMVMALTLAALGDTSRKIHLYDTFAGMTRPGEVDRRARDGAEQITRWQHFQRGDHNEWCYASLAEVRANMASTGYPADKLVLVEGKVEETLPAQAPAEIALLRLDTDWYQSTRHELEHLYPRLSAGGVLVLDDYGSFEGARKAVDEYFAENGVGIYLHRVDSTGRIAILPG
ncbi:MAG: TylF/MycF/NovP-related O-methyltransferase [Rhodospirillales bacterium]|jgi:hypothetical protein|nr:TylF/MycF/NovP-related O-methyltransferase [Rhodospirillales bacterium]HJO73200.1 TylF/MycF/NovP-related O-methyltransferase [Rhodospirillales bacterium]